MKISPDLNCSRRDLSNEYTDRYDVTSNRKCGTGGGRPGTFAFGASNFDRLPDPLMNRQSEKQGVFAKESTIPRRMAFSDFDFADPHFKVASTIKLSIRLAGPER